MTPYYQDARVTVHAGDCLAVLPELPDASVDAVVTDPPYALGFMGQKWDTYAREVNRRPSTKAHTFDHVGGNHNPSNSADAARTRRVEGQRYGGWCQQWAAECLRVLKPGGHLLAFGGTRTYHRLTSGIEDAGFEIRDSITWLYGSGFPKSLDVSKAIDKAAGIEREDLGPGQWAHVKAGGTWHGEVYGDEPAHGQGPRSTVPATEAARRWSGWGTALKPASEPIVVARKPLAGTVAANVLAHGTGALNIDACRVGDRISLDEGARGRRPRGMGETGERRGDPLPNGPTYRPGDGGRWPPNVALDDSQAAELDAQSGERPAGGSLSGHEPSDSFGGAVYGENGRRPWASHGDTGGASRFFPTFRYEAKADAAERPRHGEVAHPTVKPVPLMRWLVRLVTPPGGLVLDLFAGSGTTGEACQAEGFNCILIERGAEYLPLIVQRLTKRTDPVRHLADKGADLGLFELLEEMGEVAG